MNAKQRKEARILAWVLVAMGPLSTGMLVLSLGGNLDSVQVILGVSMLLPMLFGLALLVMLKKLPPEDSEISP